MKHKSEEELKVIFAKNLNYYLDKSGRTQAEVAEAIDVIPTTFSSWVRGVSLPRMGKIEKLADYFHILKTDLIEEHSDASYYSFLVEDQFNIEVADLMNRISQEARLRKYLEAYLSLSEDKRKLVEDITYSYLPDNDNDQKQT